MTAPSASSVHKVLLRDLWGTEQETQAARILDPGPLPAQIAVDGFGVVAVGFHPEELCWIAHLVADSGTRNLAVRPREADCALVIDVLVNHDGRGVQVVIPRMTGEPHSFAGRQGAVDCNFCGGGAQHYLHAEDRS